MRPHMGSAMFKSCDTSRQTRCRRRRFTCSLIKAAEAMLVTFPQVTECSNRQVSCMLLSIEWKKISLRSSTTLYKLKQLELTASNVSSCKRRKLRDLFQQRNMGVVFSNWKALIKGGELQSGAEVASFQLEK